VSIGAWLLGQLDLPSGRDTVEFPSENRHFAAGCPLL